MGFGRRRRRWLAAPRLQLMAVEVVRVRTRERCAGLGSWGGSIVPCERCVERRGRRSCSRIGVERRGYLARMRYRYGGATRLHKDDV